jgi:hypothetical protein
MWPIDRNGTDQNDVAHTLSDCGPNDVFGGTHIDGRETIFGTIGLAELVG